MIPSGPTSAQKERRLLGSLARIDRALVAFSGGVDSAYLLAVAHEALGDRVSAMTARSPSLPSDELAAAVAFCRELGVVHRIVDTHEMDRGGYRANGADRCYHCKSELFDASSLLAAREDASVLDGFNVDDLSDHRPGHQAAQEHEVRHPLAEVGLRKEEIRALSRARGLPTWNKAQLACLASRVPHGVEVTNARLARVEQVEQGLRALGFHDLRARLVRGDDEMLRLEIGVDELHRALELRAELVSVGKGSGFRRITLDLEGFRSGSMNEDLVQLRGAARG
ncbi:MAG: ATP-dependent sacrificial sulfur transferase LarE [Myxococcota bacterium]